MHPPKYTMHIQAHIHPVSAIVRGHLSVSLPSLSSPPLSSTSLSYTTLTPVHMYTPPLSVPSLDAKL
jgi:hypothetical protein